MSKTYISKELRQLTWTRAENSCEYCLLPRNSTVLEFHIDHIIAEQHNGPTALENLALSCMHCNTFKGSNLGTYLPEKKLAVWLYNPRLDEWKDHFDLLVSGLIIGKTDVGEGSIRLLRLNEFMRKETRGLLLQAKVALLHQ